MERVTLRYEFEDENGEISRTDVEVEVSNKGSLPRDEVCEAFAKFLEAAGWSSHGLNEMFED